MTVTRGLRRAALTSVVLLGLSAAAVGVGLLIVVRPLPRADDLVRQSSPDTTKIYDRDGRLLFEVLDPLGGRRTRVKLSELPASLVQAVVLTEDAGFYDNPGVEPRAIVRAALEALARGRPVSGASTITQQLARLVLMDDAERSQRTVRRKLREMVMAVRLARRYSKDEILERYLNEVYFGQLAYGAEAAAQTYFAKPAAQLDMAESALLAGLIQSPATYNPLVDVDAARRRQSVVLGLMVTGGAISKSEAAAAAGEQLTFAAGDGPMEAPHFVSWVESQLEARFGEHTVQRGGLHVVTSLDLDLQRQAEAVVRRRVGELQRHEPGKPDYNVSDAAVVALDVSTGQVLAMVGSADYFDRSIDGAVNVALALRQPGSAIKPLTYATAFDTERWGVRHPADDPAGAPQLPFTPATVLSDVPTSFLTREGEPYRPLNYDRMWHGPITLRRALATSSNMVAVKVLDAVGVGALIDTSEALGIHTLSDRERYGLALTLGGGEVRLLELTAAYAGLAGGGRRVTPVSVLAVLDGAQFREGLERPADWQGVGDVTARPVISPQAAFLVTDILSDDAARLPAFGEQGVLALDRPAAAKTGTTTDFRDNWTLGYTPDLAVGVWLGNADGSPMRYISGITGAAPIWHEVMEAAHRGRPVGTFARPLGLVPLEVCAAGGGLPGELCRRRAMEWFVQGTEPQTVDRSYVSVAVDSVTGLAWDDACRGEQLPRVFRLLPADAVEWGRSAGVELPPEVGCSGRPRRSSAAAAAAAAPSDPSGMEGLVVTSPAANAVFALTDDLPRQYQQLELAVRPGSAGDLEDVTVQVDGQEVAMPGRPPYQAFWPMEAGEHTVTANGRDAAGRTVRSDVIRFKVLEAKE
jgi:penicillin-binding protein 1C